VALPIIIGLGVFFAVAGDLANKIAEWGSFVWGWPDDETAWRLYDIGNELNTSIAWGIALALVPKLRLKYTAKLILHYLLTVALAYNLLDLADEIISDNTRSCIPDLVGLAIAVGYGCASFGLHRTICRSSHVPVAGSYYRVLRAPKSLMGVPVFLIRRKREYYMNGNLWVRRKSGWETPVKHRIREGVVLRYCGSAKRLMESVTKDLGGN